MANNYNQKLQSKNTDLQTIINTIENLPNVGQGDTTLPTLDNEGVTSNLLLNKELINSSGEKIVGIMPNNGDISTSMDGINVKNITIPRGYTDGGTISLDDTIDNEISVQTDLLAQTVAAL
jgi:hypothetical protein